MKKRAIGPLPAVSEEEIRQYYQKNSTLYTRPETVVIGILEEERPLLDRLWNEGLQGEKFLVAMQRYFKQPLEVERKTLNELKEPIRSVIAKLSEGEVSAPMQAGPVSQMVYLVERQSATPIPLEKVLKEVETAAAIQKHAAIKRSFVAQIRARSKVKVNLQEWRKIATGGEIL